MECKKCGSLANGNFCSSCGSSLLVKGLAPAPPAGPLTPGPMLMAPPPMVLPQHPTSASSSRRSGLPRWAIAATGGGVLVLVLAGGLVFSLLGRAVSTTANPVAAAVAKTHAVTGTMTLHDSDEYWSEYGPCDGSGGYGDISAGAQVTVKDGTGNTVAVSSLGPGTATSSTTCDFSFQIDVLRDVEYYEFEVSHRGGLTYSASDLEKNGWSVDIVLGDD